MKNADKYPLRAIRACCLDCADGYVQYVKFCPSDGTHSTRCPLWPFRFGMMPRTAAQRYGATLVNPNLMPEATANLDDLTKREYEVAQEKKQAS